MKKEKLHRKSGGGLFEKVTHFEAFMISVQLSNTMHPPRRTVALGSSARGTPPPSVTVRRGPSPLPASEDGEKVTDPTESVSEATGEGGRGTPGDGSTSDEGSLGGGPFVRIPIEARTDAVARGTGDGPHPTERLE